MYLTACNIAALCLLALQTISLLAY